MFHQNPYLGGRWPWCWPHKGTLKRSRSAEKKKVPRNSSHKKWRFTSGLKFLTRGKSKREKNAYIEKGWILLKTLNSLDSFCSWDLKTPNVKGGEIQSNPLAWVEKSREMRHPEPFQWNGFPGEKAVFTLWAIGDSVIFEYGWCLKFISSKNTAQWD